MTSVYRFTQGDINALLVVVVRVLLVSTARPLRLTKLGGAATTAAVVVNDLNYLEQQVIYLC